MTIEELQIAVKGLDAWRASGYVTSMIPLSLQPPIEEAARMWLNPNLEALVEHLNYLTGIGLTFGEANELIGAAFDPPERKTRDDASSILR
jgi:hypothetical protein